MSPKFTPNSGAAAKNSDAPGFEKKGERDAGGVCVWERGRGEDPSCSIPYGVAAGIFDAIDLRRRLGAF